MKEKNGGYTRIIRIGARTKDNAEMVLLELVAKGEKAVKVSNKRNPKPAAKASAKKVEKKASEITAKTGEKKSAFKPLANIKQMVTRQKKGSS
jgi:large subunit ribosomal protein L17